MTQCPLICLQYPGNDASTRSNTCEPVSSFALEYSYNPPILARPIWFEPFHVDALRPRHALARHIHRGFLLSMF
jgi:hypothetical protein